MSDNLIGNNWWGHILRPTGVPGYYYGWDSYVIYLPEEKTPMTEQQWLSSTDPAAMLEYIRPQASERKLWLFYEARACEQCQEITEGDELLEQVAYVATADCFTLEYSCLLLRLIFGNPFRRVETMEIVDPGDGKGPLLNKAGHSMYGLKEWMVSPDVLAIAQTIYDNRDASGFAPLWDALEEAGCDNVEIRHALKWRQRCPKCLGAGHIIGASWKVGEYVTARCINCNGTGWLPIPGKPFCPRGFWVNDCILGLQ